jgi:hypothetical protein
MARKAIQGYPEKSYYDNTRYLGIVATTDPLNEGLFKHMVNFDVSDTGQSVEPRDGFLTTTLKSNNVKTFTLTNNSTSITNGSTVGIQVGNLVVGVGIQPNTFVTSITNETSLILNKTTTENITTPLTFSFVISLSNKSIIFKDHNINEYVIYDLLNNRGYLADVSAYNLTEKYLPITQLITGLDWTYLVSFLISQVNFIKSYYTAVVGTDTVKYETTRDYIRLYLKFIPDTKIDHIYDENGVSKTLIRVSLEAPNQSKVNFIIQMYYRRNALTINNTTVTLNILNMSVPQNENTLIFEVLDTFTHPTLAGTERNLAVSKSIVPEVFQNLYTEPTSINPFSTNPRPSGHITTLGNFVYAYDNENKYVNNFIQRGKDYTIKPYFSLNPAAIQLNNEFEIVRTGTTAVGSSTVTNINVQDIVVGQDVIGFGIPGGTQVNTVNALNNTITISNAATEASTTNLSFVLKNSKWAYKVEFFNTSTDVTDKTKEVIFSSPWMSYDGVNSNPVKLFNATRTSISLGNEDSNLNHYQGSRFVIFIVPKTSIITTTTSKEIELDGTLTETFPAKKTNSTTQFELIGYTINSFIPNYNTWKNAIDQIKNLKTLRDTVNSLSTSAVFHVYNLASSPTTGDFEEFESSLQSTNTSNTRSFSIPTNKEETSYKMFLTGEKLLEFIETNNIFKTNYNITFKLLPLATKDTVTTTANANTFNSSSSFSTRTPYYFNAVPTAGEGSNLKIPVNTVVQVVNTGLTEHGYIYRQTSSTTSMAYTQVTTTGGNIPTNAFIKGAYYFDDRRDVYYQWNNDTGFSGSLTSVTNPTTPVITTRWFFASLNYWSGNSAYSDYLTKTNVNINSDFFFFKKINNQTSLETNIEELGNYTLPEVNFISAYQFGTAPIRISENPPGLGFNAEQNTYIHAKSNNRVYRQAGRYFSLFPGSGLYFASYSDNWINLGIATNVDSNNLTFSFTRINNNKTITTSSSITGLQVGMTITGTGIPSETTVESITLPGTIVMSKEATSSGTSNLTFNWIVINLNAAPYNNLNNFTVYRDTRTNLTYRWNNASSTIGTFTPYVNQTLALEDEGFFDKGVTGIFYMKPYTDSDFLNALGAPKNFEELETLKVFWGATSFTQPFNLVYTYDEQEVTYIQEKLIEEPKQIETANNLIVFESSVILTWSNNVLYISEAGKYYWFKAKNKVEFNEEIVKVLQYKQIILVFTTQNLYAVYRVETVSTQLNTTTNQIEQNVTGVVWLKQAVLYNLLVNKEYADVIQVFNQMVLFYSEDGQLFMIRPSGTIDDQTRFSVQYFNKAANDILKNYHVYINERLASYGSSVRVKKEEVKIKALVSINFIKLIYYVPGVITYMLIYDVINNRYTAYDSLTFTNMFDKLFIESGDLFITEQNNKLYFTLPYVEQNTRDNHVDMTFNNNFKKEGINCLIDTGNMNLNNHLYKRFRDLHVTFKNLNASNVLFNLETMIDEIIAKPFYNEQLQVIDSNNISYYVTVKKENNKDLIELVDVNLISDLANDVVKYSLTNNLFENNNILMDFSEYTSSKLLTHRTSILGLGKVFRLKLQFISKGLYKLQNFGIIYKERRI